MLDEEANQAEQAEQHALARPKPRAWLHGEEFAKWQHDQAYLKLQQDQAPGVEDNDPGSMETLNVAEIIAERDQARADHRKEMASRKHKAFESRQYHAQRDVARQERDAAQREHDFARKERDAARATLAAALAACRCGKVAELGPVRKMGAALAGVGEKKKSHKRKAQVDQHQHQHQQQQQQQQQMSFDSYRHGEEDMRGYQVSSNGSWKAAAVTELRKRYHEDPNEEPRMDTPVPHCTCTGAKVKAYKGGQSWQSACCTVTLSQHPLPAKPSAPGKRIAGRKMSFGVFNRLLEHLKVQGVDVESSIDLKDHWALHGTNKYRIIPAAEDEM
eukprot:SM000048S16542  [mRNA]  locus=s48:355930:357688:+ [translate_table: standard]